jgi:hypothetical protein
MEQENLSRYLSVVIMRACPLLSELSSSLPSAQNKEMKEPQSIVARSSSSIHWQVDAAALVFCCLNWGNL